METKQFTSYRTFGIILCDSYFKFGKGRRVVECRYRVIGYDEIKMCSIIDVGYDVDITEYPNYKNTYEEYSTLEAAEAAL